MNKHDHIVDKIEKLLAKGNGSGVTEAESQSFILMAQKLMAKYNIDQAELGNTDNEEVIVDKTCSGSYSPWRSSLMSIITKNFRTRYLVCGKQFFVVGTVQDVQITVSIFNYVSTYLDKKMYNLRRKYRAKGFDTEGISGDYCMGFLSGLRDQLDDQVNKEGWGLIIVTPTAVVDKAEEMKNGTRESSRKIKTAGMSDLYASGYEDGNTLQVGHKQLGAG